MKLHEAIQRALKPLTALRTLHALQALTEPVDTAVQLAREDSAREKVIQRELARQHADIDRELAEYSESVAREATIG